MGRTVRQKITYIRFFVPAEKLNRGNYRVKLAPGMSAVNRKTLSLPWG